MSEIKWIHHHTPTLEAHDARGVTVRHVAWQRAEAQQPAQRRINLTRLDPAGQRREQWDPRRFERLDQGEGVPPSQQSITSLSGMALLSESRDAGWQLVLPGEAGQMRESWDTRNSQWQTDYDELLRPVLIRERADGQPERVAERYGYSGEAGANRRGRLIRHDDAAGTRSIDSYSLSGQVQSETRRFLSALALPNWPDELADRDALLEAGDGASTLFRHGPLGDVLEHTDALGNRQHSRFNLSGELAATGLKLADGPEHSLLVNARYNAFGQVEIQTAGNGVISQAVYDPADGRLQRLIARRPGRATLQDLLYAYDRVGNVIRIEDLSQPVRHFANQRVDPVSTFAYDSLYQLHEATGREAAGALIGPQLPDLAPDPGDTSRLLNYRQLYDYDASGNLLSLRHTGQQSYTRTMAVDENSNRAVAAPGDPLTAFDANGNLLALQPAQPLHWNARNQLHSTRQVVRENAENDEEHYRYGGDGLRVRKVINRLVSGRMQHSETRYLPGLELHIRAGERFAVITTQAGRYAVRCLHWSEGQPEGIVNPQLRYSLDDLHGSSGLELDGEARVISHEGYYPFGGTAWWAANSAVEASYKSHRYSGKERDSSGLYDYGLRYYAPWLARWINPDPAGDVDGLNLYCMVRNNPLRFKDSDGLALIEALDLAASSPSRPQLTAALLKTNPGVAKRRSLFSEETKSLLHAARKNSLDLERMKNAKKQAFLKEHPGLPTNANLQKFSAHAGITLREDELYRSGFTNFSGSLSPQNPFPGVLLLQRKSSLTFAPIPKEPRKHLGYFLVSNTNAMLKGIKEVYNLGGAELHPYLEKLIREHIEASDFRIPIQAGIPGLHAEVQALNTLLFDAAPESLQATLSQGFVFTERLVKAPGQPPGSDFPACYNCSGILPRIINVVTGRVTPERRFVEKIRSESPLKSQRM